MRVIPEGRAWAIPPIPVALAFLLLVAPGLGGSHQAQAQVIRGKLFDNETRLPVINGTVTLFDDSLGASVARTLTGSDGRFILRVPRPGQYTLRGWGLGYRGGLEPRLVLAEGDSVVMDLYLMPDPLELEPLRISAERVRSELERQGFFQRREQGRGFFLTPSQLKAHPPITEAELLDRAPFVELQRSWLGSRVRMRSFGQACDPTIFIDNNPIAKGEMVEDFVRFPGRRGPRGISRARRDSERAGHGLRDLWRDHDMDGLERAALTEGRGRWALGGWEAFPPFPAVDCGPAPPGPTWSGLREESPVGPSSERKGPE